MSFVSDHAGSFIRHSRAGGSPVELASEHRMPLDSRLRGNDEMSDHMQINHLMRSNVLTRFTFDILQNQLC